MPLQRRIRKNTFSLWLKSWTRTSQSCWTRTRISYLDEYRKSTGSAENMRSQIQDYIADAARAKLAEDKAKAENEVLRREAAALREQLAKERRRESRREERAEQAAAEQAAADEKQG